MKHELDDRYEGEVRDYRNNKPNKETELSDFDILDMEPQERMKQMPKQTPTT